MIRKIAQTILLILFVLILSSCHTIHGMGQDIEGGGKAIKRSSGE